MTTPRMPIRLEGKRVWVAGHRGLVGTALVRRLASRRLRDPDGRPREVDLRRQAEVERWMKRGAAAGGVLAAASVGGILANDTRPAEFLYDNLMIQTNVIEASRRARRREAAVPRLVLHLSAPRRQPIREDALLTGPLEPTNQWYAVAKIAGIKLCQAYRRQYGCDFISAMPTNLYGPGDNFDLMHEPCRAGADGQGPSPPSSSAAPSSRSGAPARRGASSCMSTISPTRWFS